MEEARRAREKAEEQASRAHEEALHRLQEEGERLRRAREEELAAREELNSRVPRCYMCGELGVKKSRNCPNQARHKGRRTLPN